MGHNEDRHAWAVDDQPREHDHELAGICVSAKVVHAVTDDSHFAVGLVAHYLKVAVNAPGVPKRS